MNDTFRIRPLTLPVLLIALTGSSGCGLIFGGDQRVDNHSHDYTVLRLDLETKGEWTRLERGEAAPEERADVAFEHKKSGALISLNSVCRAYRETSLEELSKHLLMGLNASGESKYIDIEIDGEKAIAVEVDTSLSKKKGRSKANLDQKTETPVRLKAVVLKKSGCVFDFMYVATSEVFLTHLSTFERFLKGFHGPE